MKSTAFSAFMPRSLNASWICRISSLVDEARVGALTGFLSFAWPELRPPNTRPHQQPAAGCASSSPWHQSGDVDAFLNTPSTKKMATEVAIAQVAQFSLVVHSKNGPGPADYGPGFGLSGNDGIARKYS